MASTAPHLTALTLPTLLERLERMSPEERLRTYWNGTMTRAERSAWAGAFPEEAPLVNDELEWIALSAE
jgi:hypothetical protein